MFVWHCGDSVPAGRRRPKPAVIVNQRAISTGEFELAWRRLKRDGNVQSLIPEKIELVRKNLLENLVRQELLLQDAAARGITVAPEEVEAEVARAQGDYGKPDQFEETLLADLLTPEAFRDMAAKSLLVRKVLEQAAFGGLAASDEEIAAYYRANTKEFGRPAEVHMLHIVTKTEEEAQQAQKELQSGADFAAVALKYSISPEGRNGGDMGYFAQGTMPKVFDEHGFALRKGQTSALVASEYGFHIFRIADRREASQKTLDEAREAIRAKLLIDKRRTAEAEYVAALTAAAQIRYFPENLAAIR